VLVRFRLHELQRVDNDGHVAFRAPLPDELVHLQRRELYRLETPVTDSPQLLLPPAKPRRSPVDAGGGHQRRRPGGGGANDCAVGLQKRYPAQLSLPDGPDLDIELVVCNLLPQRQPNGIEVKRVGMRFDSLPRGADSAIQRYIFRIDRQRKARRNGEL
jgi:c-di-GMP-binding flagellar brake protein YcgR